ncbi:hypothetical protein BGZ59_007555 [Podila verticillata]|nr:hypothetical protein BGZ59_007555 [Podila verticillata]
MDSDMDSATKTFPDNIAASIDSLGMMQVKDSSVPNDLTQGSPHSLISTSASSLSSTGSLLHQHHNPHDNLIHRIHGDYTHSTGPTRTHSRAHSSNSQHSLNLIMNRTNQSEPFHLNPSINTSLSSNIESTLGNSRSGNTIIKESHGSDYLSSPNDTEGPSGGPESPGTTPSTWATSPPMRPQNPVVSTSHSSGGGLTSPASLSSPVHLSQQPKPKKDKNPFGGMSASFLETLPATGMKLYPSSKKSSKSHGDMLNAAGNSYNGNNHYHKVKKSGGVGPLSSINTRKQQLSPGGLHSNERSYSSSTSNISSPMTPEHKAHLTTATQHYMSSPTLSRNHHSLDARVMAREMSLGHSTEDVWQALCIKVLTLFNGQGLTGAIEDLNDLVRRCLMTRNAFALCDEISELLKNGMLTLNTKLGDVPDEKLVSRLVELWSFFFGTVLPYFEGVFLPLQIDLKMYHSRKITRKNTGGTGGGSFSNISSSVGGGGGTIGAVGGSLLGAGGLESSMAVSSPKMALEERNEDSEPENVRIMALTGFRDLVILPMVDRLGDVFAKLFMDFDASIPVTDTASRMLQMTSVLTSIQSGDAQQLLMEQVSNRLKTNWKQFTRRGNRGGFAGIERKVPVSTS